MVALLDIFDPDDIFFMRLGGFINDHDYQEILYALQQCEIEDSLVVLHEGCKEEHIVEDQLEVPHEVDCKDLAEEDKVGKNSNYDDLMNVSQCADVSNKKKEEATKFEEEL